MWTLVRPSSCSVLAFERLLAIGATMSLVAGRFSQELALSAFAVRDAVGLGGVSSGGRGRRIGVRTAVPHTCPNGCSGGAVALR